MIEKMLQEKDAPMKIRILKLVVGGIAAFVAEELARRGVDRLFDEDAETDTEEE